MKSLQILFVKFEVIFLTKNSRTQSLYCKIRVSNS